MKNETNIIIIKINQMKYAAIAALLAPASATTSFTASVDEQEAARAAQAITERVMNWGNDNQDDLMTAAMAIQGVVEDFLVIEQAADIVRADAFTTLIDYGRQMGYADPEACDEEAFARCVIESNGFNMQDFGRGALWEIFATDCAVTNGCTTPCINPEIEAAR